MTKIPALSLAVLLLAPAAAFAGAATDNARETFESEGASAAQSVNPQVASQLRDRLAAEGYGNVTDLQPGYGGYTATAVKDGKVTEVLIDPASGKVNRLR